MESFLKYEEHQNIDVKYGDLFFGHEKGVNSLCFCEPDKLVTGSKESVIVWTIKLKSGDLRDVFFFTGTVNDIQQWDYMNVLIANSRGSVVSLNIYTLQIEKTFEQNDSSKAQKVLKVSNDQFVVLYKTKFLLWAYETKSVVKRLRRFDTLYFPVLVRSLSANESVFLTYKTETKRKRGRNETKYHVCLYEYKRNRIIKRYGGNSKDAYYMISTYLRKGRRREVLICSGDNKYLLFFDVQGTGKPFRKVKTSRKASSFVFLGRYLFSGDWVGQVTIHDLKTYRKVKTIPFTKEFHPGINSGIVRSLDFKPLIEKNKLFVFVGCMNEGRSNLRVLEVSSSEYFKVDSKIVEVSENDLRERVEYLNNLMDQGWCEDDGQIVEFRIGYPISCVKMLKIFLVL